MSRSLDRLTLLERFIRIAEAGSISAAARDLGLSQPSVSRQLAELEARLETVLVHRTTHTLSVTEAGRALLVEARDLVGRWDALEEHHRAGRSALAGRVKVVAPVALGQTELTAIVAGFQRDHPGVAVEWLLEDAPIRFSETGCDCWIRIGPVPDETLIVRRLGAVERLLVGTPEFAASGKRATPSALSDTPLVALAPFEDAAIPLRHRNGREVRLRPPVRTRTNNLVAAREAALAGIGIVVMPRWFVEDALRDGSLVDLLPGWRAPSLDLNIAYASDRYHPARLRAFIDCIRNSVPTIAGIGR